MREFINKKLKEILKKHTMWINNETDGERADLRYENLSSEVLRYADLRFADLSYANLSCANLSCAKNVPFVPYVCPDYGSFIGYKKANDYIVELEILSDALRCSATSRKCRCNKAKVLSI